MGLTTVQRYCAACDQNTRIPGLSYDVVCMIIDLAILLEHRLVTDRQTDGQAHNNGKYRASIA